MIDDPNKTDLLIAMYASFIQQEKTMGPWNRETRNVQLRCLIASFMVGLPYDRLSSTVALRFFPGSPKRYSLLAAVRFNTFFGDG
jgi:hypothetical protein